MPRLVEFDWAVHVPSASSAGTARRGPTASLNLVVEEPPTSAHLMPPTRSVTVEMDPATLGHVVSKLTGGVMILLSVQTHYMFVARDSTSEKGNAPCDYLSTTTKTSVDLVKCLTLLYGIRDQLEGMTGPK